MYTLVSAIGVSVTKNSRWGSVDIGAMPMNTIFATYRRVIVTLTNPYITGNIGLDLDQIRLSTQALTVTFNQYLTQIGSATLPTITGTIPTINPVYARSADAFYAGYTVLPVGPTQAADAQLPESDKTWLNLTNSAVLPADVYKYCMVSVNGYWHWIETDGNAIYVRDGDVSRQLSGQAQCGVMSFKNLGALTYVDLASSMIYKPDSTVPGQYRTYFNLGQDIGDKIPILVLGGYMHILDTKTFMRVGVNTFMIDMENYPMLNRYYESLPYLDWSGFNLPKTSKNASQVGLADLLSDATIAKYFDMSQTFMVLLDAKEVFVDRDWVRTTPFQGMYLAYKRPYWPLVTGFGRMCEYWWKMEDTDFPQYSLTVRDAIKYNYIFETTSDPNAQRSVSNALDVNNPPVNSPAFFRLIGSDIDLSGLNAATS